MVCWNEWAGGEAGGNSVTQGLRCFVVLAQRYIAAEMPAFAGVSDMYNLRGSLVMCCTLQLSGCSPQPQYFGKAATASASVVLLWTPCAASWPQQTVVMLCTLPPSCSSLVAHPVCLRTSRTATTASHASLWWHARAQTQPCSTSTCYATHTTPTKVCQCMPIPARAVVCCRVAAIQHSCFDTVLQTWE